MIDGSEDSSESEEATARHRANQVLRDAIEEAEDAICVYDEHDVFVMANRQYFRLYPYLKDEVHLVGRTFEEVLRISLAHRVVQTAQAVEDPESYVRDRMLDRNLGRPMPERLLSDGRWYLIKERRTPAGYTITRRVDITERKLAELELASARDALEERTRALERAASEAELARRQAEEAGAARARFLATMSHELRTPMTGLLAVIDLFARRPLDDEGDRLLRVMRGSAEHLLELLDDILDFSKFEAERVVLEPVRFRPAGLVEQVMDLFDQRIADRGLSVQVAIDPDLPPVLVGDVLRLRQLLANLISNAVKFTPAGSITVTLGTDGVKDGICRLTGSVSDTGIGIAPAVASTLFDAFRQGDPSTTRRYGGTGLGLAICKRIVTAMGGEIGIDSAEGEGSTFRFSVALLVGEAEPSRDRERPTAPAPIQPLHILLAEDNEANRMLIAQYLVGDGHRVTEVADGREAVAAVDAAPYDVVLMDMQMPVMDGDEATRRIRAGPRPQTPIVALTADAIPANHAAYRRAGVDDVVTKPVDWAVLEATLGAVTSADRGKPGPSTGESDVSGVRGGSPLFDRAYVVRTLGVIAPERAAALLAELPSSLAALLDDVAAAVSAEDHGAARRAAHSLKGTAASFGATRLAESAAGTEAACAAGTAGPGEIEALRRAAAETVDALGEVGRWLGTPGRP